MDVSSPSSRLTCPSCLETFARPEHLRRHLRKHTGEKPFVCPHCGREFARSDSLKRHETLHQTGEADSEPSASSQKQHTLRGEAVGSGHVYESQSANVLSRRDFVPSATPGQGVAYPASQYVSHVAGPSPFFDAGHENSFDINWLPTTDPVSLGPNMFDMLWEVQPTSPVQHDANEAVQNTQSSPPLGSVPLQLYDSPYSEAVMSESSQPSDLRSVSASDLEGSRGDFYVDGGTTRLAKGRKRKPSRHVPSEDPDARNVRQMRVSIYEAEEIAAPLEGAVYISQTNYHAIIESFRHTSTIDSGSNYFLADERILSRKMLNDLVICAVKYFLPTLPFIHVPTLQTQACSWILYMALAVIGTRYESQIVDARANNLMELLRRTFSLAGETWSAQSSTLEITQAKLLTSIALLHTGNMNQIRKGRAIFNEVVAFCREWTSFIDKDPSLSTEDQRTSRQSVYRTAHAIWLLDSIQVYQTSFPGSLQLKDATAPLPGDDEAWLFCGTEYAQRDEELDEMPMPSLVDAVETLYIEKVMDDRVGEFGRTLLIHALLEHTRGILTQCRSRLATWHPQGSGGSASSAHDDSPRSPLTEQQWPPNITVYARWRNAACDCLDTLHWHANAVIGKASGHEHPTVLFLHLARVALLAPTHDMLSMASILAGEETAPRTKIETLSRSLTRWARQDCYKARLAIIHAGVLLYHVRRHSMDSFYEPSAVFLSVLCLWAYGLAYASHDPAEQPEHWQDSSRSSPDEAAPPLPSLIQLDRPCDDELVQLFITHGHRIKPTLAGVDDLCDPDGPRRSLEVGLRVIQYARNWDVTGKYIRTMERLRARSLPPERTSEHSGGTSLNL